MMTRLAISRVATLCFASALLVVGTGVSGFISTNGFTLRSQQSGVSRRWNTCGRRPKGGALMMGRRAAKIAATKGKEDARRGKAFARMGKKIIMAVKSGGPSEESNKLLADTIKEARRANVPKDNIARAIKRATDGSQGDYKEAVYEAYGHGGTGMVITALTDNLNRAVADVKTVWKKHGLKQAAQGSVLFQFKKKGKVEVKGQLEEEEVIEAAIEAGVDDVDVVEGEEEGTTWVLTDPKDLTTLTEALSNANVDGESSLALIPESVAEVDDQAMELNLAAIEALLELEDVDSVEHNMA